MSLNTVALPLERLARLNRFSACNRVTVGEEIAIDLDEIVRAHRICDDPPGWSIKVAGDDLMLVNADSGSGNTLLRPGAQRRDWKQTLISDGFIVVRHPSWEAARDMCFEAAKHIQLYAS